MSPVEITQREMYDALVALTTQMSIANEKLDYLCHTDRDHEKRLRSLESRRWPLPILGALLGLTAIVLSVWSLA